MCKHLHQLDLLYIFTYAFRSKKIRQEKEEENITFSLIK